MAEKEKFLSKVRLCISERRLPWRLTHFFKKFIIYPLLKNPNTKEHWDKRFEKPELFKERGIKLYGDLLEFLPVSKKFTLLDVGCGTGDGCIFLKEHFPEAEISGCDFSPNAIDNAKSKNKEIDFFILDILKEDLPKKHDYITMVSLLEHLDRPFFVVDKCSKKTDKILIINCPYEQEITYNVADEHRFAFNEKTLKEYTSVYYIKPDKVNVGGKRIIYLIKAKEKQ